jgi:hypothetical protein
LFHVSGDIVTVVGGVGEDAVKAVVGFFEGDGSDAVAQVGLAVAAVIVGEVWSEGISIASDYSSFTKNTNGSAFTSSFILFTTIFVTIIGVCLSLLFSASISFGFKRGPFEWILFNIPLWIVRRSNSLTVNLKSISKLITCAVSPLL